MTDILRLSVPLTVWLAVFSAVYGLHGLICSSRWAEMGLSPEAGRWALVVAAALGVALQIALLFALRRPPYAARPGFIRGLSLNLALVGLVATIWTLMPVVTTTACL